MDHHRKGATPISPEVALANDVFDQFCAASTFKSILGHYRHLCELLHCKPTNFPLFYPKLKAKLRSWKAQALWNKYDKRATHKCYNRGKACPNTRVLIIGAGPCGLRAAIEAQLLGAKVVVVEKRDRMSRNNVLHLWPFVIQDLRALGAKKFFGKFCAGSIDHISIRQLQCILLKVALIFGVEIHEGVSFEGLIPPPDDQSDERGWRAEVIPSDHPMSQYEFDVLIGADGKRNTLEGFKRKEFRGKLAIAITANFINRRSEAEARVEEISGVAFIFNQKFFKDLYAATGIDLENIVYYKDETHYFVMTAKKHSLLDKGVILNDYADTAKLLSPDNVDKTALMGYAREAADFSTNYKLPHLESAVNHYGQPDVAMFDFTSMYAAENASRVVEKNGHRLLMTLVGDSLLEPFWPTGSGCARGFLSSMDACWAVRGWGMGNNPLEVLAERESIYRILGQTTPENLHRDYGGYTLDPHTRYPNLNSRAVLPLQARGLYASDNPDAIEQCLKTPTIDLPKKRRRRDSQVHPDTLLHWLKKQVALYDDVKIEDMTKSFKDGLALCAIIHRYRPDLLDFHSLRPDDIAKNNQLAFDTLERELGIPPVMTGLEMAQCEVPDKLAMLSYLSQIYDTFRGEIPHIKHPKLEEDELLPIKKEDEISAATMSARLRNLTPAQRVSLIGRLTTPVQPPVRKRHATSSLPRADNVPLTRRARKRRSAGSDRERPTLQMIQDEFSDRQRVREEIEQNRKERMMRRMYLRHLANQQFHKSMQMLQSNTRYDSDNSPFEDYSLFVYRQTAADFKERVKDLERKMNPFQAEKEAKLQAEIRRGAPDGDFSGRIKNLEAKLKGTLPTDKKPKDLNRAIGKIEKTDWNYREIEKKIEENKMGRGTRARQEKVPKWSREQFADKFSAVERKLKARANDSVPNKYADIDVSLKRFEQKIKEGSVLEQGRNKVSAMAAQLAHKNQQETEKPVVQKSNTRSALALPAQGGSEMCHFCNKRVYLMERLSAEGRFFHRGCFRCEYCSTTLRLGSYAFDRDGKFGSKFFCTYHFGLQGTQRMRANRKVEEISKTPGKENALPKQAQTPKLSENVDGDIDGLDRGTTPERVEFENLVALGMSDEEDAMKAASEMDEDEWTDRNFGASAAEGSSDEISDLSDSEDDDEDDDAEADFAEALTADETLRLAENWTRRHSQAPDAHGEKQDLAREDRLKDDDDESGSCHDSDDSHERFSYQEYDSEDDESDTATEGEEEIRARELRKKEVELRVPERQSSDSGSETEVASDDEYSESLGSEEEEDDDDDDEEEEEEENSATEIETDSEFEHDGSRPEIPDIVISESVQVKKGKLEEPRKVKVLTRPLYRKEIVTENKIKPADVQLEFTPLVPEKPPVLINNVINNNIPSPLINPRRGDYLLNRTHSTEGIASKISLELKKRYLLGPTNLAGSVKKSGSASTLDTKFKSLVDQISEHQKLLNPAPEPSPTMQAFLQGADKLRISPTISPTPHSFNTTKKEKELPKLGDFGHVCSLKNNTPDPILIKEDNKNIINEVEQKNMIIGKNNDKLELGSTFDMKDKNDVAQQLNVSENECRPRSPAHETSIVVPDFPRSENNKNDEHDEDDDMESDSLSSDITTGSDDDKSEDDHKNKPIINLPPKVEIHNSRGELMDDNGINVVKDESVPDDDETTPPLDSLNMSIPDICQTTTALPSLETNQNISLKYDTNTIDLVPKINEPSDMNSSSFNTKIITVPSTENDKSSEGQILKQVSTPAELFVSDEGILDGKVSGRSSPSSPISIRNDDSEEDNKNDLTTAALTETELSDWARDEDGVVSENFDDLELNINPQFITFRRQQKPRNRRNARGVAARIARTEDFDEEYTHVCGKIDKIPPPSTLLTNIDNIEFMDTGGEEDTSTDDGLRHAAAMRNSGYIQFVNPTDDEDDISTPLAEALPPIYTTLSDNQDTSKDNDDEESSRLNEDTTTTSNSEAITIMDSPLIEQQKSIGDSTTTTTTTTNNESESNNLLSPCVETSSSTYEDYVKRLQGRISPFSNVRDSIDIRKSRKNHKLLLDNNFKTEGINEDTIVNTNNVVNNEINDDVNKIDKSLSTSNLILNKSPEMRKLEEISRERSKQKDIIHDMVMNKLMSQRKSPQDRKNKRNTRGSSSPITCQGSLNSIISIPTSNDDKSTKSTPSSSSNQIKQSSDCTKNLSISSIERPKSIASPEHVILKLNDTLERRHSVHQTSSSSPSPVKTPNVKIYDENDLKTPLSDNEQTRYTTPLTSFQPSNNDSYNKPRSLSVHSSFRNLQKSKTTNENFVLPETPLTIHHEAYSLPDIRKALFDSGNILKTPVVPSGNKLNYSSERHLDSACIREKARKKAQMKTDEELGLSPEDRIKKLKERMLSARKDKKSNPSLNHSEELLSGSSNCNVATTPILTKDKNLVQKDLHKQSDSLTNADLSGGDNNSASGQGATSPNKESKCDRKKSKDRDRRKSIIQAVSDFFHKKSPLSPSSPPKTSQPGSPPSGSQSQSSSTKFPKFRIHRKDKSKSANSSDYDDYEDGPKLSPGRTKCVSESEARRRLIDGAAPPVPPPPVNYTPQVIRQSEDSCSEIEEDSRATQLDGGNETPGGSLKKSGRMSRRMARQAQLKRLRMAQEIQRQLEEVEVKQKELEAQGVLLEKAIRGESNEGGQDESELTQKWFQLMRERNELRRYEHELTVRAQDVELEDTHARLQQELRERLAKDDAEKSAEEVAKEGHILREMLQIVERRDALHALLEEEHQRYKEEAKDLEAQMLAKGLRLTSVTKTESNI